MKVYIYTSTVKCVHYSKLITEKCIYIIYTQFLCVGMSVEARSDFMSPHRNINMTFYTQNPLQKNWYWFTPKLIFKKCRFLHWNHTLNIFALISHTFFFRVSRWILSEPRVIKCHRAAVSTSSPLRYLMNLLRYVMIYIHFTVMHALYCTCYI